MIIGKKVPFSYVFKKIQTDLLFILAVGLVFNYLSDVFDAVIPEMPISVPTFLGTGISVLLSFKMSQSYDRWWEARKVWGAIVNDSRSLVLQLQTFVGGGTATRRMAYRQIAWCHALGQSLRGTDPMARLERYLDREELEVIAKHANKPLAIVQLNAAELRELKNGPGLDVFAQVQLDNTLVRLVDAMGKAERINSTVFPVTYRLFLHYAIYLFVIVLSVALRNVQPLFEIPLLLLISSVFFLLEKTAYHLQDPFRGRPSDVPVTAIATTIEINIRQLLGEQEVPRPLQSEGFYVL
ncbi:bestrophin family ion channel [Paraflavisolibacter sp. H34]|uniref:bestrophin family protein n=1 Tax=Huijunlia imazamoxiresistens TaxID=3127457 RepID=UPI00301728FC